VGGALLLHSHSKPKPCRKRRDALAITILEEVYEKGRLG